MRPCCTAACGSTAAPATTERRARNSVSVQTSIAPASPARPLRCPGARHDRSSGDVGSPRGSATRRKGPGTSALSLHQFHLCRMSGDIRSTPGPPHGLPRKPTQRGGAAHRPPENVRSSSRKRGPARPPRDRVRPADPPALSARGSGGFEPGIAVLPMSGGSFRLKARETVPAVDWAVSNDPRATGVSRRARRAVD